MSESQWRLGITRSLIENAPDSELIESAFLREASKGRHHGKSNPIPHRSGNLHHPLGWLGKSGKTAHHQILHSLWRLEFLNVPAEPTSVALMEVPTLDKRSQRLRRKEGAPARPFMKTNREFSTTPLGRREYLANELQDRLL